VVNASVSSSSSCIYRENNRRWLLSEKCGNAEEQFREFEVVTINNL